MNLKKYKINPCESVKSVSPVRKKLSNRVSIVSLLVKLGALVFLWHNLCASQSQRIILKTGESFEDTIQCYKNSALFLKNAGKLTRQELQEIKFLPPAPAPIKGFKDTIPVRQILETSAKAERQFKDANGITLLDDEVSTLYPDGSRTYKWHFIGKILKPETRDWATMEFGFDETREKINILLARTIHPDGTISYLDRSKIKISIPAQGTVYLTKQYRVMSFNFPNVSIGDIVECVYEEKVIKPSDPKKFNPCEFFQSYEPVVQHKSKIIIPDTLDLNIYTRNFSDTALAIPGITTDAGNKIYIWEITNTPGIVKEPGMPGRIDFVPGVFTTLFKNWDYLFDREAKFELRRMEVTPEIKRLTKKIVLPAKTLDDSIAEIYHWVQQNIRYMSIKGSRSSGTAGHPASMTLKNKFGDCIDKAVLFSTMLKAIDVNAYPVGVLTGGRGHPPLNEIPISWSNHAITQVRLQNRTFYLDPTSETFRYPYFSAGEHGVLCINNILRSIDTIPVPPPDWNAENYFYDVTLDSGGNAIVNFEAKYTGSLEAWKRARWKYTSEDERPHKIQDALCKEFPGAVLMDYKIGEFENLGQQFSESWTYKLKDYPIKASDLWIFKLPGLKKKEFPEVALATRKYNLVYSTSREYTQQAYLKIPPGYKVEHLPAPIEIKCKYASYKAEYRKLPDGTIEYEDKFSRWGHIIDVKDYQEYRTFLNKVANYSTRQIFLRKPTT